MPKVSEFFTAEEFIPKELYLDYGPRAMRFIDSRLLDIMDYIREEAGHPITINNWHLGGSFNESGLRIPGHSNYKRSSCHSFGRAVDFRSDKISVDELKKIILETDCEELKTMGLTAIEKNTPSWVHISVSNFKNWQGLESQNGIILLNP